MDTIVKVNTKKRTMKAQNKLLGVSGENKVNNLVFEMDEFIQGNPRLEVVQNGNKYTIYSKDFTQVNQTYVLPVKNSMLTWVGVLQAEFCLYNSDGDLTFKTKINEELEVVEAINATATIPDEYTTWYEQAENKITEMERIDVTASKSGKTATITITHHDNTITSVEIKDGVSISSIAKTGTAGLTDTYTIFYDDGRTDTLTVVNGNGIDHIEKTNTSGLVDTYTIYYTDGTTATYTVKNGDKGDKGDIGPTPNISVKSTTTGVAGTNASVALDPTSTPENPKFNFVIPRGNTGATPEISVKSTTTGQAGTDANVSLDASSTPENPKFNFTIPRGNTGATGATPNISVGTVTTGAAGTDAEVELDESSTAENPVFNFTIPQGEDGEITYDKVTDEYSNASDELYNTVYINKEKNRLKGIIPSKAAEGESIEITDGQPYEFLGLEIKGNTTQETTEGKQLLNVVGTKTDQGITSVRTNDGKIVSTGTTATSYFTIVEDVSVNFVAGTYTFSIDKPLHYGIKLRLKNENDETIGNYTISAGNTSVTFTTATDAKYWRIYAEGNVTVGMQINTTIYPMLEAGSSATSFEPYTGGASPNPDYPQDITTVTGDIKVINNGGKNLWNILEQLTGTEVTTTDNTNYKFMPSALSRIYTINGKPNTIYKLKLTISSETGGRMDFYFQYSDGTRSWCADFNQDSAATRSREVVSNEGKTVVGLQIQTYNMDTHKTYTFTEPMISERITPTAPPYEPFVASYKKTLSLGNIELCEIDTAQDKIYRENDITSANFGKWYLRKEIDKAVLDETLNYGTGPNNTIQIPSNISSLMVRPVNDSTVPSLYCSHLKPVYWNANWNDSSGIIAMKSAYDDVRIKIKNITTLADFKTWLSEHNITLYYALRTPTTTEITGTLAEQLEEWYQAGLFKGINNITTDTIAELKIKYAYDIEKYINSLEARIELLET